MGFDEEFQRRTERINQLICEDGSVVASDYDCELVEAMNYSLKAGGKRLRPMLIECFYRLYGGMDDLATCFMIGMEMLHTYSLVHDDLPAIDNDEFRRGLLTTHKKYGEATAILAGDALLHEAYEVILRGMQKAQGENLTRMLRALMIFGEKTGIHGMLGGQAADVIHSGEVLPDDLLHYVYEKKTGALIEGSMMIGAALAGADEQELSKVEAIGSRIGLAFQIQDDILDLIGDAKVLGKPTQSDEKNNKKTYVSVHGMEESKADIIRLSREAGELLRTCGKNAEETDYIAGLFDYLTKRVS